MNLRPHLGDTPMLAGELLDPAAFCDRASERLLTVGVPPALESKGGGDGMGVIGRGNDDRFNVALVQKAAKVSVGPGGRMLLGGSREELFIHVAEGHDILAGDIIQVVGALIGDADHSNVELVVGRQFSRAARGLTAGQPKTGCSESGVLEKLPAATQEAHTF